MSVIWATRGRSWGFRFLLTGELKEPLLAYERVFADVPDSESAYRRTGETVGLRFPDPLGRKDRSGRTIPHEFVLTGVEAAKVHSVEEGLEVVWPIVSAIYEGIWDGSSAPQGRVSTPAEWARG